jgi:hypothetical protein
LFSYNENIHAIIGSKCPKTMEERRKLMVLNVASTHIGHFATETEGRTVGSRKRIIRNKAQEGRNR